jgi:hypothetical protein
MKKNYWKKKITEACISAGVYKGFYDNVIMELAQIMEIRDEAMKQYKASGNSPVIKYTNKGGYTNLKKNPALVVVNEQTAQALAYWRDLGLTPKGYKILTGEGIEEKKGGTFETMLEKLEI